MLWRFIKKPGKASLIRKNRIKPFPFQRNLCYYSRRDNLKVRYQRYNKECGSKALGIAVGEKTSREYGRTKHAQYTL
jgi:hypothetical protein